MTFFMRELMRMLLLFFFCTTLKNANTSTTLLILKWVEMVQLTDATIN